MNNIAIIGLGSNIEPDKNIETARQLLREHFQVLKESSFIRNPACGLTQQPEFVNGAILVKTDFDRVALKTFLKDLERRMGRTEAMRGQAPRNIDFDIHVWNDEIVDPYFYEWPFIRRFVLELVPDLQYDAAKVKAS